jgi:hypothetical protein
LLPAVVRCEDEIVGDTGYSPPRQAGAGAGGTIGEQQVRETQRW